MAGYDLSYQSTKTNRKLAQDWLSKFKSFAKKYALDVSFSTKIIKNNKLEIYVTVDGKLWAMQHLHRELPELFVYYIHIAPFSSFKTKKLLFDFYSGNQKGLKGITRLVFDVSNQMGGRPTGPTLSNTIREKIENKSPRKREIKALKNILISLDRWVLNKITKEQCMILCDQAIENWLKGMLYAPSNDRRNFNLLRDAAVNNNVITKTESYRLKRFHRARNRVQHRGKKASSQTLANMIDYYLYLGNKYNV